MRETSGIPTAIAEALERYEHVRESVYKELEIKYVQNLVTCKLLNIESKEVELLFYKDKEDAEADLFISDNDSTASNDSHEQEKSCFSEKSEESLNFEAKSNALKNKESQAKVPKPRLSKYLDLDAEYSGDEEVDEELDEDEANSMIDNSCDNSIDLGKYTKEMNINNKRQLEDLKNKFLKRRRKKDAIPEYAQNTYVLDDSVEEFPEIQEFEFLDETSNFEDDIKNADKREISEDNEFQERKRIEDDCDFFNDQSRALEKLTKKDNTKNIGFFEKENKL